MADYANRKVNINVYFEQDTLKRLDDFKNRNSSEYSSRSDVIRAAVEKFLSQG